MPDEDPNQMNVASAHEGENVADSAPVNSGDRHEDVPARAHESTPVSSPSPGPMSAREDHALTTLQRQREMLAHQARAGDRTALRRYLQLRRR